MNEFKLKKYTTSTILAPDLAILASTYGKMDAKRHPPKVEEFPDVGRAAEGGHYKYGDPFMETLLVHMLPTIEELTGLELLATYSFYRIYRPGDKLEIHVDRPSCEISASMCLGYNYVNLPEDYFWALWVRGDDGIDIPLNLKPGEGAIYRGEDIEHWRDPFVAPLGSWHMQAFLHYVDKNGPYTDREFDGRPGIGYEDKKEWETYIDDDGVQRYL